MTRPFMACQSWFTAPHAIEVQTEILLQMRWVAGAFRSKLWWAKSRYFLINVEEVHPRKAWESLPLAKQNLGSSL